MRKNDELKRQNKHGLLMDSSIKYQMCRNRSFRIAMQSYDIHILSKLLMCQRTCRARARECASETKMKIFIHYFGLQ